MTGNHMLLVGCGILKNEIRHLIEENHWPLDTYFLDSALHIDFEALSLSLKSALAAHEDRNIIVFYGCCHPLMEKMLEDAGTIRTVGQNCVDMLLGNEIFTEELSKGAFFLLEDWARRWEQISEKTFGKHRAVMREIFRGDRKYMLALTTPCSGDFRAEAEAAASAAGLPLRWMEVSLDHLKAVIETALARKNEAL
ncbi:MAG: DUF1638 domain-containing protein [Nitrospirae bacterium]|nr:DUF1638 domain-containing protein [Nitrospirota bacterium]